MFRLFDRHAQRPNRDHVDAGSLYSGEWFETGRVEHDYMLEILPPLWMGGDMFALREFLTDSITSVFYTLRIDGKTRHFHAYTRKERLEHIWSATHDEYRGYAGDRWLPKHCGKRTVLCYGGRQGAMPKLLDELTDDEIAAKLPVHLRHLPLAVAA
ncbi:DUF1419 domain-containing protein [Mesorhizobium sp. M1338]|uniref:DUF1419 domain-containing protein n=1 Tax=Mesorhizobium sp. M1338 TaxID=2957085 RepID=UPI00333B7F26